MDRKDLFKLKDKKSGTERIPLVITYSKYLLDIGKILRKHERTLHRSDRMREFFPDSPLLAFRRDKNICNTLVHTKTNKAIGIDTRSCHCDISRMIKKDKVSDTENNYYDVLTIDL